MNLRWLNLFALWLAVACYPALAATAEVNSQNPFPDISQLGPQPLNLTSYFSVLEDSSQQLGLAQIHSADMAARFHTVERVSKSSGHELSSLNLGISQSSFWLRLHLRNSSPHAVESMLEIAYPDLTEIEFYQTAMIKSDGEAVFKPDASASPLDSSFPAYQVTRTGSGEAFVKRPYPNRFFVFPLQLAANTEEIVYLRVKSQVNVEVPAKLWQKQAFHAHERADYAAQAWYFGMVLALVTFNLLLLMVLRDFNYFWYVFFATCLAVTVASTSGMASQFLWPHATYWNSIATLSCASLSSAILILFMRRMLATQRLFKRLDRWLLVCVYAHLLLLLMLYFWFESIVPYSLISHALTAGLVLVTGIMCAFKRERDAYFFVFSFATLCFAVILSSMRAFGILPSNIWTNDGVQFSSALHLLLQALALVDRFNTVRQERAKAQRETFEAQQKLVANLQSSERELEQVVNRRTESLSQSNAALSRANTELNTAYEAAETSRQQAEKAQLQATRSLQDLRAAQTQLVQSEKMAALGQLIAGVAHEINTPIGAVKSSGKNIADALGTTLNNLPKLFKALDVASLDLFLQLIHSANQASPVLSTREERAMIRQATQELEELAIGEARHKGSILVQLNAHTNIKHYLPLLKHAESELILDTAHNLATIINSTDNINIAVERVAKIIFALKSFSYANPEGNWREVQLQDGIEAVISLYQHQLKQGTELVRNYEKIPALFCMPDELNQVWTNLIHNAMQAMQNKGTLSIRISQEAEFALVEISDTGCGIPDAIKSKIFEAFFTTKPAGEGSGLGLDIVKKIVLQHHGKIEVQSEVGVGTSFFVYLPYRQQASAGTA